MLQLSTDLALPLEAVTETFAILAKRGSGKTYTAAVLTEQMIGAGHPVVVIDPVGVWWGLRSSADGESPGLPIVIFGGDHADLPLDEGAGAVVADAVVAERFSTIIDLSHLSKAASTRFMTAFIERIYHRNREPLHIVVDEADAFAPQRGATGHGARLLGAMEDLVRRGRARGIGCTLITQRPAVLHKDVLTQAEVLICLRMNGVRDVQAIDEWVRLHADPDEARDMKVSLPSLPVGTAWVWSPGWLGILEKVAIARRTTFDSSATPKVGEQRIEPRRMADVDLAALGAQVAAATESAQADDPKHLRAEVARLRKEISEREEAREEVPVIDEHQLQVLTRILEALPEAVRRLTELEETIDAIRCSTVAAPTPTPAPVKRAASAPESRPTATGDGPKLGKTERTLLAALAQHGELTHSQLALLAGYSAKASTVRNGLAALRKAGLVAEGQPIAATPAGLEAIGDDYKPLPTGARLLAYWRDRFGMTEQRVLDALVDVWPATSSAADVAARTGYSPSASTIRNALAKLRKVGVVDGWRLDEDFAEKAGLS